MPYPTHEVTNQPPPLLDYNVYAGDRILQAAVARDGAVWAHDALLDFGGRCGRAETIQWGFQANASPPVLRTHDRYGHRIDEVEFHPAYHALMALAVEHGLHGQPWRAPGAGAHVARAAHFFLLTQVEAGVGCPISMTYSGVPALRLQPEIAAEWEPRLTSLEYDGRLVPTNQKRGALCGMAMTEKQGGSDVRVNATRAEPGGTRSGPGAEYRLTGHKWFCSAPMCDAFLVLAHTPRGQSCFLVPRFLPDGTKNRFFLQRLKDKLGNRSNASSEVEFDDTWGRMVGEEGRGVPTIIEMVNHTRLDCVIGSAAGIRAAVTQALHHTRHRVAFGKTLVDQPLMRNVLADLCLESEAATATMTRLARAYDEAQSSGDRTFARIATAVAKYWVCKRQPAVVVEALECLGGAGYVEESGLPRLYREAPLNMIWEGSGNVIALDVLRAMAHGPEPVERFFTELGVARGRDRRFDAYLDALQSELRDADAIEYRARGLVERMAIGLQASLLLMDAPTAVADAFCASRLGTGHGLQLGTLPRGVDLAALIDRATPDA